MGDAQARDEGGGGYEIGCGDVEPGARSVWWEILVECTGQILEEVGDGGDDLI